MSKKITIVGRGINGCVATSHFLKHSDWEIDWVYDPTMESNPVGEGTNLILPQFLLVNMSLTWDDLLSLDSTTKIGVLKKNWSTGKEFLHGFRLGHTGIHMNAVKLQDFLFDRLKNSSRIKLIEKNIDNEKSFDSNHTLICTGTPNDFNELNERQYIPVNSCIVSQCPWEHARFDYSLTYAMPNGWLFGIPLKNRISIGYLYNDTINSEEEIYNDIEKFLKENKFTAESQRLIKFKNYSRKINFSDTVSYTGNSSFFLEPLEATSTGLACQLTNILWNNIVKNKFSIKELNEFYLQKLNEVETMICLHYYAGSIYKTRFWQYAKGLAYEKIDQALKTDNSFRDMLEKIFYSSSEEDGSNKTDYGTWHIRSLRNNINNLYIRDRLEQHYQLYK